jgi:hypothetical protein
MTKDEVQHSRMTFYEAVRFDGTIFLWVNFDQGAKEKQQ